MRPSFNGISGLVNAGKASSQGVELATSFHATDQFTDRPQHRLHEGDIKNDFRADGYPAGRFDVILNTGRRAIAALCARNGRGR